MRVWRQKFSLFHFVKLAIGVLPIITILYAMNQRTGFTGLIAAEYRFKNRQALISELKPQYYLEDFERSIADKTTYRRILGNPIEFSVRTPFSPRHLDLEIEYKNPGAPLVQIGIKKGGGTNEWKFYPIENRYLEQKDWFRLEDQNRKLVLLQKPEKNFNKSPNYKSIDDFLKNLPKKEGIAFYGYNPLIDYRIPGYQPIKKLTVFEQSLRGNHSIVTYIQNEDLDFTIYYDSRNPEIENPKMEINLFYGTKFLRRFEEKNGNKIRVYLRDLPDGIYELDIQIDSDVMIRKIEILQQVFAFKNRLVLDEPSQSSIWFLQTPDLSFKTVHPDGLQTLQVNEKTLTLEEMYRYYSADNISSFSSITEVRIPKNDLVMEFSGLAGPTTENLEPIALPLVSLGEVAKGISGDFQYLLAVKPESIPRHKKGWSIFQKTFGPDDLFVQNDQIHFILSIPGVHGGSGFKINRIKAKLKK